MELVRRATIFHAAEKPVIQKIHIRVRATSSRGVTHLALHAALGCLWVSVQALLVTQLNTHREYSTSFISHSMAFKKCQYTIIMFFFKQ